MASARKGVAVTRSLGRPVTAWAEMREAVAHHAARAGGELRAEGLVATLMAVLLRTGPQYCGPWHSARHVGASSPPPTRAR